VEIFSRQGAAPRRVATLTDPEPRVQDGFGFALDADGERLVVGSCSEHAVNGRVANVFVGGASQWALEARLTEFPANPAPEWTFSSTRGYGCDVAISGDTVAVGDFTDSRSEEELDLSGAVYVYERGSQGWTLGQTLRPSDPGDGQAFGVAVDLGPDHLVVGASGFAPKVRRSHGRIYVYARTGSGPWTLAQIRADAEPRIGDGFGRDVALAGDRVLVGFYTSQAWWTPPVGLIYGLAAR
jgi:hypothetical protein